LESIKMRKSSLTLRRGSSKSREASLAEERGFSVDKPGERESTRADTVERSQRVSEVVVCGPCGKFVLFNSFSF